MLFTISNFWLFVVLLVVAPMLTVATSLLVRRITAHFTGESQVVRTASSSTKP